MTSHEFLLKQEQARQARYTRSIFRRINSLDLIPEHPSQEEDSAESCHEDHEHVRGTLANGICRKTPPTRRMSLTVSHGVRKLLLFWPNLLARLIMIVVRYILYIPLSIAAPSFWLSAMLWIFWKLIRIPVGMVKWIINSETFPPAASSLSPSPSSSSSSFTAAPNHHTTLPAAKRTILISSGSTIQCLHLARNLYCSGARVIVVEFDGLFGLARFSSAVDKFYVVPRPSTRNPDSYIAALCQIVKKEQVSVFIPVCATSPAYFDALAKPHLELLNCASFIPGLQDTIVLDDCLEFYRKCASQNIPLPPYAVLSSLHDLWHLYDSGFIRNFRNILVAVGMQGLLERFKYILPSNKRDVKFSHEISAHQQWLVIRDLPGEHFVTCTTVKDSRVVANVACKVDHDSKNLLPLTAEAAENPQAASEKAEIDRWLQTFFAKVRFQRSINGHISFRFIKCRALGVDSNAAAAGTDVLMPLGVRLGVSIPYICYTRSHAQLLTRTIKCVHNMRQLSRADEGGFTAAWSATEKTKAHQNASTMVALDKREALFAYWDPLPYCAYYHFQLPLESVKLFLQKRQQQQNNSNNNNIGTAKALSPRLTMPVH